MLKSFDLKTSWEEKTCQS